MEKVTIDKDVFSVMISAEQIQARVAELAGQLYEDYKDKVPVFIGILNGSFMFMGDLVKNYPGSCEVDFLKLSSYGDDKISSGRVKMQKELTCDVNGRDLIIVEDIVDSGLSIKFMEELIEHKHPASMKVVSLLMKPKSLKYDVKIDYIGFTIPGRFVIGYGLDYKQQYRNLPAIYALDEEV